MMAWSAALVPIFVAAAILVVPGYVTVRVLGFRGLYAWALAGPVTVPVVAAASLLAPLVGVPWTITALAATSLLAWLLALVLRLTLRNRWLVMESIRPAARAAIPLALVIGGALVAIQFVLIVTDPNNISQTFDNIFHLNAAQYIVETKNASPLSVSRLTQGDEGVTFYPAVWHGIVALVAISSNASLAVASNAVMIAAGALLWPASVLLLATHVFGRSRAYIMITGVFVAAAPAFPILMIDYGVLFPYFLALCALPAVITSTLALLGMTDRTPGTTPVPWLIVLSAMVPGLLMVHPSAFIAWLLLSGVAAIAAFVLFLRRRPSRSMVITTTAALVVAGVLAAVLWRQLRPRIDLNLWPPSQTPGQAIGEVMTLSMERAQIPVVLTVAMLVGILIIVRRGTKSSGIAVGFLLTLMTMYVITSSMQWLWLRRAIAAAWYDNSPRLAALIPMMAVPIAALGAVAGWRWIVRKSAGRVTEGTASSTALASVAVIALIAATQLISIPNAVERARSVYVPSETSPLLTTDEMTLLRALPELVPPDAVIAGNPGTGTAMAYAISGIRVLHPSVVIAMTDDISLIDNEANEAVPGSAVCAALQRTGVGYILDFGMQQINGEAYRYPGFENLATSPAVELVKEVGTARLYKIVGCDLS